MVSLPLLHGRVALVTGGGRGIGRATALQLAGLGAAVAVAARSRDEVEGVAREIAELGGRAFPVVADVAAHTGAVTAVQQVIGLAGRVDVLVNNAGVMPLGPLATSDPGEWRYTIEVNLIGAYECLRAVLPGMLARRWGRVVNVSSALAVVTAMHNRSAYVVSKAALDRLTTAAAAEVAGTGVAVSSVYPGITDTAMQAEILDAPPGVIGADQQEHVRDLYARGQVHDPREVARLIAAVVIGEFNGEIVNIEDERGQELLRAIPD